MSASGTTDRALTPYDDRWPRLFEDEAPRLLLALAPVIAIEHVGSTAVPGLAAKPTIDIAVGVPSLELRAAAARRMEELGYQYGGTHDQPQHVFRRGRDVPWEVIVHVVEHEGPMWHHYLRFRDHLRSHRADANRYEALKAALLVGRGGWYRGLDKEAFIASILTRGNR
jgi:GrpB-like predicted nucleotidyltransferase (UPF0157 family)